MLLQGALSRREALWALTAACCHKPTMTVPGKALRPSTMPCAPAPPSQNPGSPDPFTALPRLRAQMGEWAVCVGRGETAIGDGT